MPLDRFSFAGSLSEFAALQQIALIVALYKDERPKAEQLLGTGPGREVKVWNWQPLRTEPSMAILRDNNDWFIFFAGTTNVTQGIGHVGGIYGLDYPLQRGIIVNAMYYAIFFDQAKAVLDPVLPAPGGPERFHISGHSYGGALAHLYANYLVSRGVKDTRVEVLTFGGVKSLTADYEGPAPYHYFRVCDEGDPVPWLPPASAALFIVPKQGRNLLKLHRQRWVQYGDRYELTAEGQLLVSTNRESNWVDLPVPLSVSPLIEHSSDTYLRRMELRIHNLFKADPRSAPLVSLVESIIAVPDKQNDGPEPQPAQYTNQEIVNIMFGGKVPRPVTSTNLAAVRKAPAVVTGSYTLAQNIALFEELGGFMSSGFWRMTLKINDGDYGRSFTTVWAGGGSSTLKQAVAKCKLLAEQFSDLFGNFSATSGENVKAPGRPFVEYILVSDALNPRESVELPLDPNNRKFYGPPGGETYFADAASVALSMKLPGTCTVGEDTRKSSASFIITGQPDACVAKRRYNGANVIVAGATGSPSWDKYCKDTIAWIIANGFGFMGRHPAEKDQDVTEFALDADGYLLCTVTAHGFATGDVVQLKHCNQPGFKIKDRIKVTGVNEFALVTKKHSGIEILPTAGKVYRTRLKATGPRLGFYAYEEPAGGYQTPLQLRVKKKAPGAQFVPLSFSNSGTKRTI